MENIISIVSLVVSIISAMGAFKAIKVTKKVARKTLSQKFFEDIYFNEIINVIPCKLLRIINEEGKREDNRNELIKSIMYLMEKSKFYNYFDNKFYEKVKKVLVELDENLVLMGDKNLQEENLNKYIKKIQASINKFYEILKEYYFEI